MTFFNKKEDVMKIELTPYGREMLMKGHLMPQYYAFYDDDILYESQAASFSENNTLTKVRILTETPSLKPQTNYIGVESNHTNNDNVSENDNILLNPIGSNKTTSKKSNAWEATALIGEFKSSNSYISSSTSPMYNVPQIECEMNFTMSLGVMPENAYISKDYFSSELATDNTFMILKKDDMLLYLLEKNGFTYKDALSLEVFRYDYGEVKFRKLDFINTIKPIENDILKDEVEDVSGDTGTVIEEFLVENYFLLLNDYQIPNTEICRGIKKLKNKNIYLGIDISCEDDIAQEVNIYQTQVDEIEGC